jgi:hypothetical protein
MFEVIEVILWLAGLLCSIWCVLDVFKQPIGIVGKVVTSVVVLATSWLGFAVYYFWARHHITEWFK